MALTIAVDFDGSVVRHCYPEVGECIGAVDTLKDIVRSGHRLILYTMRSGPYLEEAINWFKERNIELYAANNNPEQIHWTSSPKVYAHLYIDDAALGAPLKYLGDNPRPFLDWEKVRELLIANKVIVKPE